MSNVPLLFAFTIQLEDAKWKRNEKKHLPSRPCEPGSPPDPRSPGGPGSPLLPAGMKCDTPAWPFVPTIHQHILLYYSNASQQTI